MVVVWTLLCFVSVSAITEVTFSEKSLGISLSPDDAEVFMGDAVFNTQVQAVKSAAAAKNGLKVGDVVIRVAGWSAKGATVDEVVEKIQKHKKRPLTISFATPEAEDEEDFIEDDAVVDDEDEAPPRLDPDAVAEAMRKAKEAAGWDKDPEDQSDEERAQAGIDSMISRITRENEERHREAMQNEEYRKFEEESQRAWVEYVNKRRAEKGLPPLEEKKQTQEETKDTRPICTVEDLKPTYDFRLAIKFFNETLGFTLAQEEVDAYSEGEWYHAVVEEVNDAVSREGILPGAVVRSVGKWSARDKSVEEVVEHIRLTKKRPLKIFFLISTAPNHCRRLTEEEEAAEQSKDQAADDEKQEDAETCTIDAETGTCAKEELSAKESTQPDDADSQGVLKITFEDDALGIRVHTKDANYQTADGVFHAQIRKVLARRVAKLGLQEEAIILRVNDWSARGASALDVIDHIKGSSRPLTIHFLPFGQEIPLPESSAQEGEPADDSATEEAANPESEVPEGGFATNVITFTKKGLGIRLDKGDSQTYIGDAVFNARVSKVVDEDLVASGLSVGDVVAQVGKWSAQSATIVQVVAQIKKHKKRPLQITFATPDQEQDEDEFIF